MRDGLQLGLSEPVTKISGQCKKHAAVEQIAWLSGCMSQYGGVEWLNEKSRDLDSHREE